MLVLKDRSGVDKLPPDTIALHISFRPSRKLIKRILERCPNLKKVYLAEFKAKNFFFSVFFYSHSSQNYSFGCFFTHFFYEFRRCFKM